MIQSLPRELNLDFSTILELAQVSGGYVTVRKVEENLGWDEDRVKGVLGKLLQDGVCWIDLQSQPEEEYWVAGFFSTASATTSGGSG
jgi:ESCRT-II complex subunit VPS22